MTCTLWAQHTLIRNLVHLSVMSKTNWLKYIFQWKQRARFRSRRTRIIMMRDWRERESEWVWIASVPWAIPTLFFLTVCLIYNNIAWCVVCIRPHSVFNRDKDRSILLLSHDNEITREKGKWNESVNIKAERVTLSGYWIAQIQSKWVKKKWQIFAAAKKPITLNPVTRANYSGQFFPWQICKIYKNWRWHRHSLSRLTLRENNVFFSFFLETVIPTCLQLNASNEWLNELEKSTIRSGANSSAFILFRNPVNELKMLSTTTNKKKNCVPYVIFKTLNKLSVVWGLWNYSTYRTIVWLCVLALRTHYTVSFSLNSFRH